MGVAFLGLISPQRLLAEDVIDEITAALKRRQNAVRTLRIKWTETRFCGKESGAVSGKDVTYRRTITVWLNGDKARCDYSGQTVHGRGGVVGHKGVDVTDGKLQNKYDKFAHLERGWGRTSQGAEMAAFQANGFQPFLLCLQPPGRPTTIDFPPLGWRISSPRKMVNDQPCIVFKTGNGAREESMALSLDQDYAFVQFTRSFRGQVHMQMDVSHEKDNVYGWVPKSWRFIEVNTATGNTVISVSAVVNELEINPQIPAETFDFEFPPGTLLPDGTGKGNLLVTEDGSRKWVVVDTDGNIMRSAETETGSRWGYYVLLAVAVPLALVLLGV
jgi:hypothetical protein